MLCKVQYRLDTSPLTHTSLSDSISMLTLIQVHWLSCFFSNVTSKLSPQDNSIRCFLCLEALFLTSKMLLKCVSSKLTLITLFKIRTNIPFQHYWSLPFALNLMAWSSYHNLVMYKRINIANSTAILGKPCSQGQPFANIQELGFQKDSHIPKTDNNGSLQLSCVSNMVYTEYLFSFKEYTILICAKRQMPM